ncbi:MAG TPA: glycerol-3-phosphate 1-O-acyltransferase PlsY [Bacilli bacterium]
MHFIVPIVICYFLGSITFSFIVGRLINGVDVRKYGSGNAGATNTLRVLGPVPAFLVFMLDMAKGIAAVWIGRWMGPDEIWIAILCGLSAIAGHNWPVFFNFKGGKGIATTIGVLFSLCFLPAIYAGAVGLLIIAYTRYVSFGSLVFVTILPLFLLFLDVQIEIFWASLIILVFAYIRHKSNIVKLIHGTENKIGIKH